MGIFTSIFEENWNLKQNMPKVEYFKSILKMYLISCHLLHEMQKWELMPNFSPTRFAALTTVQYRSPLVNSQV